MLKIGEFAALARISVRMLRHYDELGLLKARYVDHESGYRYYALEQLSRLNRILALKDLGLALEDIKRLLDDDLNADEIRGMLKLKQAQLSQHIRDEQARLGRVESRLRYIEQEGMLPQTEVVLKPQPSLHVLALRGSGWPGYLFQDVWKMLQGRGLTRHVSGSVTLYHSSMEFQETGKRATMPDPIEIGFIVDEDVRENVVLPDERELRVCDLPAYPQVASIVSNKVDSERHQDAIMMWRWMEQHRYRLIAPSRERYLKRAHDTGEFLTEMIYPIVSLDEED